MSSSFETEGLPTDIFGKKRTEQTGYEGGSPSWGNSDICKPEFVSILHIICGQKVKSYVCWEKSTVSLFQTA